MEKTFSVYCGRAAKHETIYFSPEFSSCHAHSHPISVILKRFFLFTPHAITVKSENFLNVKSKPRSHENRPYSVNNSFKGKKHLNVLLSLI